MQAKADSKIASPRENEEFIPRTKIVEEDNCDILLIYLPGFKKDQLNVQLTQTGTLKISGERPIGDNNWSRFYKDYSVSKNCDTNKITAKFETEILYIQQPKLITPEAKKDEEKPVNEAQNPRKSETEQPLAQNTETKNDSEQKDDTTRGDVAEEADAVQKSREEKGKEEEGQEKSGVENDGNAKRKRVDEFLGGDFMQNRVKMAKKMGRTMNVAVLVLAVIVIGICVKNFITPASNYEN